MSSLLARMRSKPKQSDDNNGQVEAAVATADIIVLNWC